ncbi:MAG TPA: CBS domain-containing protein [Gammaproteobacteria bacterium]|nr:CBS domain-containing protein [Gammaproteobacteria bacterium]
MKLENIIQRTGVVNDSMTVSQGFDECVRNQVPGIPCVDASDKVIGCFSISKTLLSAFIPEIMVDYADLLESDPGSLKIPEQRVDKILSLPACLFASKDNIEISSDTSVSTTVALMEKHRTDYLFVIDDGDYHGVVTIDGIAKRMLEIESAGS